MSLLLTAMLLYPPRVPSSIVQTNQVSVLPHSNALTAAPPYQNMTSGASPAAQGLEASSLQGRLDRQNRLFKEQAASDAVRALERRRPYSATFLSPQAHDRMRSTAVSAPDSPQSLQMDFLNRTESRTS